MAGVPNTASGGFEHVTLHLPLGLQEDPPPSGLDKVDSVPSFSSQLTRLRSVSAQLSSALPNQLHQHRASQMEHFVEASSRSLPGQSVEQPDGLAPSFPCRTLAGVSAQWESFLESPCRGQQM